MVQVKCMNIIYPINCTFEKYPKLIVKTFLFKRKKDINIQGINISEYIMLLLNVKANRKNDLILIMTPEKKGKTSE